MAVLVPGAAVGSIGEVYKCVVHELCLFCRILQSTIGSVSTLSGRYSVWGCYGMIEWVHSCAGSLLFHAMYLLSKLTRPRGT